MKLPVPHTEPSENSMRASGKTHPPLKICFGIISQNPKITRLQCHFLHENMFITETDIELLSNFPFSFQKCNWISES